MRHGRLYGYARTAGVPTLLRTLYRMEVAGGDRIPARGPGIVVSNHESVIDPFILGAATDRTLHYMAKAELFANPVLAWAMEGFATFPVDRGSGDAAALGRGAELLAGGALLGIFPQGTSKAFRQRPYHRGAARLALASGAPMIPVALVGTEHIFPTPKRKRFGLPRVLVLVAPPIPVERARPTVVAARALTRAVEDAILELRRPYGPPSHVWLD